MLLYATAQTATGGMGSTNFWIQILPFVVIFGVFWLLIIMPQRKQQKQRQTMLNSLKKGDKIITMGGLHGEIIEFDDEDVKVRIADKVEVKLTKGSIARVKN